MSKKILVVIPLFVLVSISLCGCNQTIFNPEADRFVGSWKSDEYYAMMDLGQIVTFYSDGTATINVIEGNWENKDGKLIVEIPQAGFKNNYDYEFLNDGDTLKITNHLLEQTYTYTKQ